MKFSWFVRLALVRNKGYMFTVIAFDIALSFPTYSWFYMKSKTVSSHLRKRFIWLSHAWLFLLVWVLIIHTVYQENYAIVKECRRFGLSTFRLVDVLVCRRFCLSTFRFVHASVCRRFVCRRFGLWTFWLVTYHFVAEIWSSLTFSKHFAQFIICSAQFIICFAKVFMSENMWRVLLLTYINFRKLVDNYNHSLILM